jgi:hypothetical protein
MLIHQILLTVFFLFIIQINILYFFSLGKICGYELSLHKHDDKVNETLQNIPFVIELINEQAVIKLKANIDQLDCEIKQTYRFFLRAYDCADEHKRRYSER